MISALHFPTASLFMVMVMLAASSVFTLMLFHYRPRQPVLWWLFGCVLLTGGYSLRAMPSLALLPEWFWWSGSLFVAGNLGLWIGLYQFCGQRRLLRPVHVALLCGLIWAGGLLLSYPQQLALLFAVSGCLSLLSFWTIRGAEHLGSNLLRLFIAWVFCAHGALSWLRAAVGVAGDNWQWNLSAEQLSALGLLPTAILTILRCYALLLLMHIRQQRDLEQLTITDSLTGVYNRKGFLAHAQRLLDRQQSGIYPFAVLMMDLDHFKQINDQHGHAAGDTVLRQFARLLREQLRPADCSGRLGGEEFAAVLAGVDQETALRIAERLRQRLQHLPLAINNQNLQVTVSIGVHFVESSALQIEPLLQQADSALYQAKANGRNRVHAEPATADVIAPAS